MNTPHEFYDAYCDSIYTKSNNFSQSGFDNLSTLFNQIYASYLPLDRQEPILDIGCGSGQFLYYLEKRKYTNFYGIDISRQQIDFCKEHVTQRCEVADIFEYLPRQKNAFSCIVANDLIEHISKENIIAFCHLVLGALRPGGCFLIKTPNLGNPFAIYSRYRDFTHEIGFTELSLEQTLSIAGFSSITLNPMNRRTTLREAIADRFIRFILTKMFQYQGFNAPRILSPLLVCKAVK